MISYDIYLFHYYSLVGLLNRLSDLNVEVKKYYVYGDNTFYLKIKRKYRKVVTGNLNDYSIVDKLGLLNGVEKLLLKPITSISLIISICLFINLSNRVYDIKIKGDYPLIEERLRIFLRENNVSFFSYNVNESRVKEIEQLVKTKFNNELEFVEIKKEGSILNLSYKRRRKEMVIEGKKGSLYASKDGVIKGFSLASGVKNVKVYDFVRKGDLLVNDILITSDNESIIIGTIGKVFASTFYYVEVSVNNDMDKASKQAYLLDKARYEVSKNINSDDEYVESENILVNDIDNGYMKIYYVLYEDITI